MSSNAQCDGSLYVETEDGWTSAYCWIRASKFQAFRKEEVVSVSQKETKRDAIVQVMMSDHNSFTSCYNSFRSSLCLRVAVCVSLTPHQLCFIGFCFKLARLSPQNPISLRYTIFAHFAVMAYIR